MKHGRPGKTRTTGLGENQYSARACCVQGADLHFSRRLHNPVIVKFPKGEGQHQAQGEEPELASIQVT